MENYQKERATLKNATLSIIIILTLSGSILDCLDLIFNFNFNEWFEAFDIARNLQSLGFVLLAYSLCNFERLKLKSFIFMLIVWRLLVLILNPLEIYNPYLIYTLYSIYLFWLLRIYLISPIIRNEDISDVNEYNSIGQSFIVYIPVSSFRGLLQILLLPWKNPNFETRILAYGLYIYRIKNKQFICESYTKQCIDNLIKLDGTKIEGCDFTVIHQAKINNLIGKRAITGIRDCRRFEL